MTFVSQTVLGSVAKGTSKVATFFEDKEKARKFWDDQAAERRGELIDPFPQLAWLDAGEEGARRLDAPVGRPFVRREHHLHGASVRQSGWAGRETSRREECKDEFGMGGA